MCIFCKIISGEIESSKIYEDTKTLAILDISNDFEGHTLVMPKKHCANIVDCPADVLCAVMKTVKQVSKHYVEKCGYSGVNVFCNNGKDAGQSIMHLHFHVVPQSSDAQQQIFIKPAHKARDFKKEKERLCFKN